MFWVHLKNFLSLIFNNLSLLVWFSWCLLCWELSRLQAVGNIWFSSNLKNIWLLYHQKIFHSPSFWDTICTYVRSLDIVHTHRVNVFIYFWPFCSLFCKQFVVVCYIFSSFIFLSLFIYFERERESRGGAERERES